MVSKQSVTKQLQRLGFKTHGWGRGEVAELHNILMPGEDVHEIVNGMYEGGFALLLATDYRVLLVDKKPLNYLTVEDMRFDMINEMDYSHRLVGAEIRISAGSKNFAFRSYNQPRLRKLINHVQHSMADAKRKQHSQQEGQNQHLEQINQQLQAYLFAQHHHQLQMQQQVVAGVPAQTAPQLKPSPELSDYLLAQNMLTQHKAQTGQPLTEAETTKAPIIEQLASSAMDQQQAEALPKPVAQQTDGISMEDLYSAGMEEVFGTQAEAPAVQASQPALVTPPSATTHHGILEVNPMRVAYSKLPMALRNRKFGRPQFHAHSEAKPKPLRPKTAES